MKQFQTLSGKVAVRDLPKFPKRRGSDLIQGKLVNLQALWQIDEDDNRYPGEWALGPAELVTRAMFDAADIVWIASGDIQEIAAT